MDEEEEEGTKEKDETFNNTQINSLVKFFYKNLYDKQLMDTLSSKGKQPSIKLLVKNFSILTIKGEINMYQREFLVNYLFNCLSKNN